VDCLPLAQSTKYVTIHILGSAESTKTWELTFQSRLCNVEGFEPGRISDGISCPFDGGCWVHLSQLVMISGLHSGAKLREETANSLPRLVDKASSTLPSSSFQFGTDKKPNSSLAPSARKGALDE